MLRFLLILPALLASAVQGYDFLRYDNAAARALAAAGEKYRLQPEPSAPAVVAPVPAGEVERLLYSHLAAGFALPEDWFTNADGSVLVFLSEPGCGAIIREFAVYRLQGEHYHRVGTYRILSRAYRWLPAETCFDTEGAAGGMSLCFVSPTGERRLCRFDFSQPAQVYRLAPAHAPITPAEESGACPATPLLKLYSNK